MVILIMDRFLYRAYLEKDSNELYILKDMNGKILSYIEMKKKKDYVIILLSFMVMKF